MFDQIIKQFKPLKTFILDIFNTVHLPPFIQVVFSLQVLILC